MLSIIKLGLGGAIKGSQLVEYHLHIQCKIALLNFHANSHIIAWIEYSSKDNKSQCLCMTPNLSRFSNQEWACPHSC